MTGSSPRVRSRLYLRGLRPRGSGIISACAEQTWPNRLRNPVYRDHLRVCGADCTSLLNTVSSSGSSPRVRSRREPDPAEGERHGIISACAEQTTRSCSASCVSRDHLRVCGADLRISCRLPGSYGSSPRVRSRLFRAFLHAPVAGIISACAEQTSPFKMGFSGSRDHLRVCGADLP